MHKTIASLITAVLTMGLLAASLSLAPYQAEAAVPTSGLADCETGVPCTFTVGTIPMTTTADDVIIDDDDGSRRIVGSLDLPIPGGSIELAEAELFFEPSLGDYEFIGGEARVPFPTTGILEGAVVREVPRAMFGMRPGSELGSLGAHLRPDRDYLYFFFSSGVEIELPWAGEPGTEILPDSIRFDAGYSGTFVFDPTDPYVYLGGPCPEIPFQSNGSTDGSTDSTDSTGDGTTGDTGSSGGSTGEGTTGDTGSSGGSTDGNSGEGEGPDQEGPDQEDQDQEEQDQEDPEAEERRRAAHERRNRIVGALTNTLDSQGGDDLSQDCGIGFSLGGNIPGPSGPNQQPIGGHVVVDAPGTLPMGMAIDGTSIVEFSTGVRTVGYGDISASIPIIDTFVDIGFPLGNAVIDLEASGDRIGYAVSGVLESDGTHELPIVNLPIALPGDGSVSLASQFGGERAADGTWRVDPNSFLQVSGNLGVGPKALGEVIGVELNNFATADAYLRIDRHAMTVQGSMGAEIHPALETDAGLALDAMISFDAPETSYLAATGGMRVAGTDLGDGALRIDNTGFHVRGMLTDTVTTVEMAGEITAEGASLEGTTTVEVPLDGLGEAAQSLVDDIDTAQADVDRLNGEISDLTEVLNQERHDATADLRAAQASVDKAQESLDVIDDRIATNNSKIKYLQRRISSEKRRYKRLKWYHRIKQSARHSARIAGWNGAIAGLKSANAANVGARAVAAGTLEAAKATVAVTEDALKLIPIEADPRMIALVAARETATATLQTARAVAGPVADIHGMFRTTVHLHLGTDGLGGSASAEWCTDNCVMLQAASLSVTNEGLQVCAVPGPGAPELCVWI